MENSIKTQEVKWGEKLFNFRDYTPIPFILLLLFTATPSVLSTFLGSLFILVGECLRILCLNYIGTISRTRKEHKGEKLIVEGPFALVRNPLYVANGCIVLGFTVFSSHVWLVLVGMFAWGFQYYLIVLYEEQILKKKFGQEYAAYCEHVRRWLPKKGSLSQLGLTKKLVESLRSEKRTLTAIAIVLVLLLLLS